MGGVDVARRIIISMRLIMRYTPNSALVDRVHFATPLSLPSRSVTGLSALAPAQRAGAQRLCAMALNGGRHAALSRQQLGLDRTISHFQDHAISFGFTNGYPIDSMDSYSSL